MAIKDDDKPGTVKICSGETNFSLLLTTTGHTS